MSESLRHKTTALAQRALGIDALHRKVDLALGKVEGLNQLATTVQGIAATINQLATTVQGIAATINQLATTVQGIAATINQLATTVQGIAATINQLEYKLAQLEPKVENLIEKGDSLFWQIRQSSEGFDRLRSFLAWSANRVEPWLPAESFAQTEPDYDLAGFLYNFLPNRVAVEVGAADSEFAKALSGIGYQVFCFAATSERFEKLRNETINLPRVEVFDFVI